jgi:hypothetical protein
MLLEQEDKNISKARRNYSIKLLLVFMCFYAPLVYLLVYNAVFVNRSWGTYLLFPLIFAPLLSQYVINRMANKKFPTSTGKTA